MNKQKLKAVCMKVSKEVGLSYNSVLTHYFLEQILKIIANSKERDNFIFKGGFLLSNVIGIGERTKLDIDFSIRQFELTEENIKEKFLEIINSSKSGDIVYEIVKVEEIRKEDDYGDYRFSTNYMKRTNIEITMAILLNVIQCSGRVLRPLKMSIFQT